MSLVLSPSPYVQASEIEKNEQEQEQTNQKTIAMAQPQVARPLPTPPSTQPPQNAVVTQVQRRGSGIVAAAAPVLSAASVEAQKALAAKCPHCQAFMTQAKEGGVKGVFNHATSLIAPVLQNTAAGALDKLKSRVGWLALANKIL